MGVLKASSRLMKLGEAAMGLNISDGNAPEPGVCRDELELDLLSKPAAAEEAERMAEAMADVFRRLLSGSPEASSEWIGACDDDDGDASLTDPGDLRALMSERWRESGWVKSKSEDEQEDRPTIGETVGLKRDGGCLPDGAPGTCLTLTGSAVSKHPSCCQRTAHGDPSERAALPSRGVIRGGLFLGTGAYSCTACS